MLDISVYLEKFLTHFRASTVTYVKVLHFNV